MRLKPIYLLTPTHLVFIVSLTMLLLASPTSQTFGQDDERQSVTVPQESLLPFFEKNCLRCHNEDDQNGDFRIDTLAWSINAGADAENWQDVLDVLNAGDMPPADEEQPNKKELVEVLATLTQTLTDSRAVLADSGAAVPIRRLNKREYINSMRHLFGLNLKDFSIPEDIRGDHFDTLGESQFFDVGAFENFLKLGNQISREGLRWSGRPYGDIETTRIEPETDPKGRFKNIKGYADLARVNEGQYLDAGNRILREISIRLGPDPRAFYRIKIHAGLRKDAHPLRQAVVITETSGVLGIPGTNLGTLKIHGTLDNPKTEEIVIPKRTLGMKSRVYINISESKPRTSTRGFRLYQDAIGDKNRSGSTWVDWVEIEGPIYRSRQNVLGDLIAQQKPREVKNLKKVNVRKWLDQFATEAFRRQKPEPEFIDALVEYYDQLRTDKVSDVDALSQTMGIVLASPGFLYLEEETVKESRKLTPRSFATRLAFFLWSSPPDEELYQLAETEEIFKPEVLEKQVIRMLEDDRAASFYDGFMSQWAELERLNGVSVNVKEYPSYSNGYQFSINREAVEFFRIMVQDNLSVDSLIDSDFVVVNAFLADHYGLPGNDYSNEFQRVELPPNAQRGGLITQAAFLTMGSDGNRTSPVIRGALLMEKLLNDPPSPPPPNVPELAEASDVPVSNRRIVELHQEQTACASCHKRMDPLGFGLENFDVVGKWRDFEKVGDKKIQIEAKATLVSGEKFSDLDGLRQLLMLQHRSLAKGMVESLLAYGLGRNNSFSDQDAIEEILRQTDKNNFLMRDLIISIVNSEPFQSK